MIFSVFMINSIVWDVIAFTRVITKSNDDRNWPLSTKILLQITRLVRLILDGIVMFIFIDLLVFYVRTKTEKMNLRLQRMSRFQNFIFVWCIVLAVLNFYISLYFMINVNFTYSNMASNYTVILVTETHRFLVIPFV
jgi:hypothetical protein